MVKDIVLQEMEKYTGEGLNDVAYLTTNATSDLFTVVDIATVREKRIISTVLVVRLVDDHIVIEVDRHDKPLAEALSARGVPDAQIVKAYQGEPIPA
jgi:kynureninase